MDSLINKYIVLYIYTYLPVLYMYVFYITLPLEPSEQDLHHLFYNRLRWSCQSTATMGIDNL